jgi:hypothetical protein
MTELTRRSLLAATSAVAAAGAAPAPGGDPLDIPAAIAAMPAGSRPLRRAVHPGPKPQEAINKVAAETQLAWLGKSQFGPWVKAVHS